MLTSDGKATVNGMLPGSGNATVDMVRKNIEILYQEIGNQIKLATKRKGLTQDELSEMIHLSRSSVANIEQGRHKFQAHVLYEISSALDCKVTELLPHS